MSKLHVQMSIGGIICLIFAVYIVCYLLRHDVLLPISIPSIWMLAKHWMKNFPLLVVGLLPIYVALMVFGTAVIGNYFGSILQQYFTSLFLPKKNPNRNRMYIKQIPYSV